MIPHEGIRRPGDAGRDGLAVGTGDFLSKRNHPLQACQVCLHLRPDCPRQPLANRQAVSFRSSDCGVSLLRRDPLDRPGFHPVSSVSRLNRLTHPVLLLTPKVWPDTPSSPTFATKSPTDEQETHAHQACRPASLRGRGCSTPPSVASLLAGGSPENTPSPPLDRAACWEQVGSKGMVKASSLTKGIIYAKIIGENVI
jgi:hypothetical protein